MLSSSTGAEAVPRTMERVHKVQYSENKLQLSSITANSLLAVLLLLNSLEGREDISLDLDLVKLLWRDVALLEDGLQAATELMTSIGSNTRRPSLPVALLLDVVLGAVDDLLHHTDVVLELRAEGGRKKARVLDELTARRADRIDEARRDAVEFRVAAGILVEEAARRAVGAAVLVEEADERLLGAFTIVVDRVLLVALGEEFDRREAADAILLRQRPVSVGVGVDVRNDAVGFALEVDRDLLVRRLQALAVAAPGSGEGDQSVLCRVLDDELELGSIMKESTKLTSAMSSKVWESRTSKAGAGGGLIFDLTPDFSVTLPTEGVRATYSTQYRPVFSQGCQIQNFTATIVCLRLTTVSGEPLQCWSPVSWASQASDVKDALGNPVTPYF